MLRVNGPSFKGSERDFKVKRDYTDKDLDIEKQENLTNASTVLHDIKRRFLDDRKSDGDEFILKIQKSEKFDGIGEFVGYGPLEISAKYTLKGDKEPYTIDEVALKDVEKIGNFFEKMMKRPVRDPFKDL